MPAKRQWMAGALVVLFLALVGVIMAQETRATQDDRERWDRKYGTEEFLYGTEPSRFLKDNLALLPDGGRALDVAAGEGRNAVFLARHGFDVDAVDISEEGLAKARQLAEEGGVSITTIVADLEAYALPKREYDLVVVFNYLQRNLIDDLREALKPGAIVVYQTYTVEHLDVPGASPMKREYCLEVDELRTFFEDFEIIHYSETSTEQRAVASLIARKPS